jgi:hypothetical protein
VIWDEHGSYPGNFEFPQSLAVDREDSPYVIEHGNFYVADTGNNRIEKSP